MSGKTKDEIRSRKVYLNWCKQLDIVPESEYRERNTTLINKINELIALKDERIALRDNRIAELEAQVLHVETEKEDLWNKTQRTEYELQEDLNTSQDEQRRARRERG